MSAIDSINEMKKRGMSESDIARNLQEQGYSPEEVNFSLSQANIKPASPAYSDEQGTEGMQPSMIPQSSQKNQYLQTQYGDQEMMPNVPVQQQITQEYSEEYPQYANYPEQNQQPQYEQYLPSTSDTMTEIAQEIVDEKLRNIEKNIGNLAEFKTDMDSRIKNLNERLKRIESIIDKLQLTIIKKIGDYGENLGEIKNELTKTQESFSKILNPLINKAREKETGAEKSEAQSRQAKKSKSKMDDYLTR